MRLWLADLDVIGPEADLARALRLWEHKGAAECARDEQGVAELLQLRMHQSEVVER